MKIDLSLSEQLVFLTRLCLQQGVGWRVSVGGRLPCQDSPHHYTLNEAQGRAPALAFCSVFRR